HGAAKVRDPVCGMSVDPTKTPHHATHAGADYHFCGARCRAKFVANPDTYLKPPEAPAAPPQPSQPGVVYTCPRPPEGRQIGPGSCPICGMALEPESIAAAADAPNHELADMSFRLWVSAILALPVVVIDMAGLFAGTLGNWIQFALATPVVLWGG